jgi:hypothetical protein
LTKSPKNLPASVRERLSHLANAHRYDFQQVLTTFAIERLLFRLSVSSFAKGFVVKGATLFTLWEGFPHRQTRDLDLLVLQHQTPSELVFVFRRIISHPVTADGIVFSDQITAEPIQAVQEYGGIRLHMVASLDKASVLFGIDVGYGDRITPAPVESEFPTLLNFPPPRLLAYPVETVVSEKLEAMVRLGIANSRMKDFFDLWHLARSTEFNGDQLVAAVCATFARRGTLIPEELPIALTDEFANNPSKLSQWRAFCRKDVRLQATAPLPRVVDVLVIFLAPVLNAAQTGSPLLAAWRKMKWRYERSNAAA